MLTEDCSPPLTGVMLAMPGIELVEFVAGMLLLVSIFVSELAH